MNDEILKRQSTKAKDVSRRIIRLDGQPLPEPHVTASYACKRLQSLGLVDGEGRLTSNDSYFRATLGNKYFVYRLAGITRYQVIMDYVPKKGWPPAGSFEHQQAYSEFWRTWNFSVATRADWLNRSWI